MEDREYLKKMLTEPPVKKIDLHFPLGLEVTARNLKGVTIKDALDAIHKQFKKKVSDSHPFQRVSGAEITIFVWNSKMTNWNCPSWQVSNGIKRSPGPD